MPGKDVPINRVAASEPFAGSPAPTFSLAEKAALALEISSAYIRVRWWLARYDLRRTLAAARSGPEPTAEPDREAIVVGTRLGLAVQRTLRVLPMDTRCLIQSIVLTHLLTRRGIRSALVIGVTVEPEFAAHAWVESGEIPLLPTARSVYAQLLRI